jgi:hypothetical protein
MAILLIVVLMEVSFGWFSIRPELRSKLIKRN